MLDLNAIRQRAATRANLATPANWLTPAEPTTPPISQLATVANDSRTARSCATCRHLSRVKTCRQPVAAGLLREFEIVWPEPAHGATCPAWRLNPGEATMTVLVAAGRGGWSDELMHQWLIDADTHPEAVLDALRTGALTP